MSSLAVHLVPAPFWRLRFNHCLAVSVLLTAFADGLFYDHPAGISLVLFLAAVAIGAILLNVRRAGFRHTVAALALLAVCLVPAVFSFEPLPVLVAIAGMGGFALLLNRRSEGERRQVGLALLGLYVLGPWRFIADSILVGRVVWQRHRIVDITRHLAVWCVPLGCGAVFLGLIVLANPLIALWLSRIDWSRIDDLPDLHRLLFWLIVMCLTWPLLRLRNGTLRNDTPAVVASSKPLLGPAVILRSLLLFNLLFGVETGLDATYLWAGVTLPDGMGYAEYAHRGAYPLIATAILAGIFVLVALRPGSASEASGRIRALVYLWIAQNLALVASSILRLDNYVTVYSLTILRAAAFLWIVLVGVALALIVLRIMLKRADGWLIRVNLLALAALLYGASLVDFPRIIADYNVAHCREVSGQGTTLDLAYLTGLGPQALPALDRYTAVIAARPIVETRLDQIDALHQAACRTQLAASQDMLHRDWRAWTFRRAQLWRYLDAHHQPALAYAAACDDKSWR